MDYKEIEAMWDAFQQVQEKKLSDKQKALDVDNDGDIEADDLADLRKKKNKADVVEEVPAAPIKKAPARKGDKSNADASDLPSVKKESVESVTEDIAKDAAHMTRKVTNHYIGDGSHAAVKKAHAKNVATHGKEVAGAIMKNAEHETEHNATSVGSAEKNGHHDFVKKHLGGKGSATHKAYHKHMEKVMMDSISESSEQVAEAAWLQDLAVILQGLEEKKDEHTKGATNPEGIADKESNKSKDFIAMHKKSEKDIEDKEEQGHKDVSKAGRATKAAPARGSSDQLKNGDKAVVNPVGKK
jgi:hypothetical protein